MRQTGEICDSIGIRNDFIALYVKAFNPNDCNVANLSSMQESI